MDPTGPRADVVKARHDFFERNDTSTGLVPPTILRSWRRCAERGFDSHVRPAIEPVGPIELRELHERNERLIRLCRPELEALTIEARDTGGLAILTDGAGFVLDAVGDASFAGKAAGVALRPGVRWAEASTGTNAIGTALVERRAVEVRGAEHYFEPHRILSCAAAPILDPRGAMVGALDFSGRAEIALSHALSLVRMGVDQIEHRMFADGFESCDLVRLHADRDLLGTAREGVLVFEGARLVAANRHGLKLLGLDWNALGARSFGDLFDGRPRAAADGRLVTRSGASLHARMRKPAIAVPGARLVAPLSDPAAASAPPARQLEGPVFDAATEASLRRAVRLVEGDVPILIRGETGSGKEMFARAVHAAGSRATSPFVAVNCAALPEGLIESELFGYEHGAFTGARKAGSRGLLREADGGVLFLDEIGDMPLTLQARLLRVVQERAVQPLGGGRPAPLDIRIICATHRDLVAMSADGGFRSDLYFRLAQFTFALPALREHADRGSVIEAIWRGLPRGGRTLSLATLDRLRRHDWPGNHRELVGVLKALIALSDPGEAIGPELLPATIAPLQAGAAPNAEGNLEALAVGAMRAAVQASGGNVAEAARRLGVSRSTLYRRALSRRAR
jgi:transcriptional regulator of acetoin/glycerol metabolism